VHAASTENDRARLRLRATDGREQIAEVDHCVLATGMPILDRPGSGHRMGDSGRAPQRSAAGGRRGRQRAAVEYGRPQRRARRRAACFARLHPPGRDPDVERRRTLLGLSTRRFPVRSRRCRTRGAGLPTFRSPFIGYAPPVAV
jgi:hypothetical protein